MSIRGRFPMRSVSNVLVYFADGIPTAYYFGQEGLHNILVIDLLGPSLEDVFDLCERTFSVKTVAMLAIEMVSLPEQSQIHYPIGNKPRF